MSLILDEHREYLSDSNRVAAFAGAIEQVVRPGDAVVDLGAGTGIMGLLACRAGAKRLYSIESTPLIEATRQINRANGFEERTCFIKQLSTLATIPERVDVVVADQIGRFGFEAGVVDYFVDARERFLKPGGILIPNRIELWAAPVEHPALFSQTQFWRNLPAGFDYSPACAIASNTGYPTKYTQEHLLGDAVNGVSLDLYTCGRGVFTFRGQSMVRRAGTMHGVGGWFVAQLSPSVKMSNSPLDPKSIERRNVFFPIAQPVPVAPGDRVLVEMTILPSDVMVSWKVYISSGAEPAVSKGRFSHSTWKGMLLCQEDLSRTRPSATPRLTARGEGRKTVLDLCDGVRSLEQIERLVFERHGNLFRSQAEAALFVAEVVTRYSE